MSETREAGPTLATPAPEPSILNPPIPAERRGMPTWVAVVLCSLLIYLGFIIWAQVSFGSYRYALRYLRGDRLQVYPAVKSIGTHRPGEVLSTTVSVRNHGSSSIVIVGGISDCGCVAYSGLPVTIPRASTISLPVTVHFGGEMGEWRQTILYMTDSLREPSFRAILTGRIANR